MENIPYYSLPFLTQNGLVDASGVEIPCGGYLERWREKWTMGLVLSELCQNDPTPKKWGISKEIIFNWKKMMHLLWVSVVAGRCVYHFAELPYASWETL